MSATFFVFLRESGNGSWTLYGPSGNSISGPHFLKGKMKAEEWASAFISCWPNWRLIIEEYTDEKKDRLPSEDV